MAGKVIGNLKLRIPGGKATAGPPVGSTLGQWGLNMMDFINPFNEGQPVDDLIREKIKIEKGSGKPNVDKVGKISRADLEDIAKTKMAQLNAIDLDGAIKTVAGTARSMGVVVED